MRNPERIDPLLELVAEVWKRQPDLRLGQLIANAAVLGGFDVEDGVLNKGLTILLQPVERPQTDDVSRDRG